MEEPIPDTVKHSVHTLVFQSQKRARDMFISEYAEPVAQDAYSENIRRNVKAKGEYGSVLEMSKTLKFKTIVDEAKKKGVNKSGGDVKPGEEPELVGDSGLKKGSKKSDIDSKALAVIADSKQIIDSKMKGTSKALIKKRMSSFIQPRWHAPWKLYRVAAGHTGWVKCVAIEPNNEWFATGSNDRTIKIWDLATGKIKLTYTGHVAAVRDICISERHPYLFSAGEDKTVKCWDLEQNRVVRHYHGHLSAVNAVRMHPTLNMLFTAGRDCAVRVWDMRSRQNILNLSGHSGAIADMACQGVDPQIITASHDCTEENSKNLT